jgi:hypothetical protein
MMALLKLVNLSPIKEIRERERENLWGKREKLIGVQCISNQSLILSWVYGTSKKSTIFMKNTPSKQRNNRKKGKTNEKLTLNIQ